MKFTWALFAASIGAAAIHTASAYAGPISEFSSGMRANAQPAKIAPGADGNLWFTEFNGNSIGRITPSGAISEFSNGLSTSAGPFGITAGADGNMWFTEFNTGKVGRITPSGTITEFAVGAQPYNITKGPDGNIWFAEYGANKIGRITPSGVLTEFSAGISANAGVLGITAGPDGNLWFTENLIDRIGRITPAGVVTEFSAGIRADAEPNDIASGADGNLWFTEQNGDGDLLIGRITPSGSVVENDYGAGTTGAVAFGITTGADGNTWFTNFGTNQVGVLVDGWYLVYGLSADANPEGITLGPDGALWFTETKGNRIGRLQALNASTNLNQQGLTGAWFNAATSGQGIVLDAVPDLVAPGTGILFGGWFTFDTASGDTDKQRWYTLQTSVKSNDPFADFGIYSTTGGNFNAAPAVQATQVGSAFINLTDCTHATFFYSFYDGRGGYIPLTRATNNVTCGQSATTSAAGHYLLSGAYYSPTTGGQGILFEVNPSQNLLFGAWYTYAKNGQSIGGAASQRWYTIQSNSISASATSLNNVPIFSTTRGIFDNATPVSINQVGTMNIVFNSCSTMTVTYSFTAGDNVGMVGTTTLSRLGSVPTGCGL